jgi:hypothetical protein
MPPSQKICLNSDMPKNVHGVVSLTNIYLMLKDNRRTGSGQSGHFLEKDAFA